MSLLINHVKCLLKWSSRTNVLNFTNAKFVQSLADLSNGRVQIWCIAPLAADPPVDPCNFNYPPSLTTITESNPNGSTTSTIDLRVHTRSDYKQ